MASAQPRLLQKSQSAHIQNRPLSLPPFVTHRYRHRQVSSYFHVVFAASFLRPFRVFPGRAITHAIPYRSCIRRSFCACTAIVAASTWDHNINNNIWSIASRQISKCKQNSSYTTFATATCTRCRGKKSVRNSKKSVLLSNNIVQIIFFLYDFIRALIPRSRGVSV